MWSFDGVPKGLVAYTNGEGFLEGSWGGRFNSWVPWLMLRTDYGTVYVEHRNARVSKTMTFYPGQWDRGDVASRFLSLELGLSFCNNQAAVYLEVVLDKQALSTFLVSKKCQPISVLTYLMGVLHLTVVTCFYFNAPTLKSCLNQ